MKDTKIEWARHTFNPWIGCTKVTAACDNCYAEARMDHRLKTVQWGPHGERKRTTAQYWRQPIAWNKAAIAAGERHFVFCASLADVFDNQVDAQWRADLFNLIRATPQLVWLLLTKRPGNIVKMVEAAGGLPANVALGTSCGDQDDADRNVPLLLAAAAELRPIFTFVSAEPLLGPIQLGALSWPKNKHDRRNWFIDALRGRFCSDAGDGGSFPAKLDWIIVGGESGPGARPMHPQWVHRIRTQCEAAGTAFFFKQWGEWKNPGCEVEPGDVLLDGIVMRRSGKRENGRMLHGRFYDALPDVRP